VSLIISEEKYTNSDYYKSFGNDDDNDNDEEIKDDEMSLAKIQSTPSASLFKQNSAGPAARKGSMTINQQVKLAESSSPTPP
jgi:hypothetical protein